MAETLHFHDVVHFVIRSPTICCWGIAFRQQDFGNAKCSVVRAKLVPFVACSYLSCIDRLEVVHIQSFYIGAGRGNHSRAASLTAGAAASVKASGAWTAAWADKVGPAVAGGTLLGGLYFGCSIVVRSGTTIGPGVA